MSANGHRVELPQPELDISLIEPKPDAAQQQERDEPSPANDVALAEQAPGIPEIASTPLPGSAVAEQQDMPVRNVILSEAKNPPVPASQSS